MDILNDFMSKANERFVYEFIFCDLYPSNLRQISRSNIVVIKSLDDFQFIDSAYEVVRYQDEPIKYFVLIPDLTYEQLKSSLVFSHYRRIIAQSTAVFMHSYFITNEIDTVTLSTVEWFSPEACNYSHLRKLNTFNKNSKKWNKKLENYEKFLNYHGCELVMMLQSIWSDGSIDHVCGYSVTINWNSNFVIYGLTPVVFDIASSAYNFTAEYQPVKIEFNWFRKEQPDVYMIDIKGN